VIMDQMDATRKDLADKLEKLEEKVTGTVATVTDLVEKVPETVTTVKDTIAETVSTVTDTVHNTVEAVKDTVEDTVGAVTGTLRNLFNIPRHVDRHPWLMMGGSVLLGFLGGRLLLPRREPEALPPSSTGQPAAPPPAPTYQAPTYQPPAPSYESSHAHEQSGEGESEGAGEGWLGRLGGKFGDEISKVKGMALGTLLGVARDMITQWVPETLRQDVTSVINNFTTDLGGKVFDKPILGGNGQSPDESDGGSSPAHGESQEQSEEPEPHTAGTATASTGRRGGRGKR